MKINVPSSLKECRPDQCVKWLYLAPFIQQQKDASLSNLLDFQVQMVSIFSDLPVSKVKKAHVDDVLKISEHLFSMLAQYDKAEPSEILEIEGKRYRFEKDFSLISTGQIIDLKLIENVNDSPAEALAICYIEEGMEYCQEDQRGRVLNPNKQREEIFKRSFPGDEFMNFFSFFFAQLQGAESRYVGDTTDEDEDTGEENQSELIQNSEWFNWTKILLSLAEALNKDVDQITKQPYVKSLFWMNYFRLKSEQEYINIKHG